MVYVLSYFPFSTLKCVMIGRDVYGDEDVGVYIVLMI
jgi:hypothetical protein